MLSAGPAGKRAHGQRRGFGGVQGTPQPPCISAPSPFKGLPFPLAEKSSLLLNPRVTSQRLLGLIFWGGRGQVASCGAVGRAGGGHPRGHSAEGAQRLAPAASWAFLRVFAAGHGANLLGDTLRGPAFEPPVPGEGQGARRCPPQSQRAPKWVVSEGPSFSEAIFTD